jgi:nucleoid-associated protein YgaU
MFFDFAKNAGEKLIDKQDLGNKMKEMAVIAVLKKRIDTLGIKVDGLEIGLEGDAVSLSGNAASQADREKAILAVGNVDGIAKVSDKMTVGADAYTATFHTVEKGEWLSKIAQKYYDDSSKYMVIFEANKPMLKDPDSIYPGQVLRIPKLSA